MVPLFIARILRPQASARAVRAKPTPKTRSTNYSIHYKLLLLSLKYELRKERSYP